ncbi:hypothetical protein Tco_0728654 [Tanacetum coccineum]|uniref:Uncharacterized protein n=1 Tax=Tanacetum coccineum TaxID=301880 RepID=A0ABQ4YQ79_9ASTR
MSHLLSRRHWSLLHQSTRKLQQSSHLSPEITPFISLQLRVARLEQEMSEVKKTDHSTDVLASIKSQVPTSIKNQESEKSPKEIIRIKREQGEEKQDSTYSIRIVKKNRMSNNHLSRSLPVSKSSGGMLNGVSLVDHSRNSSSFSDAKHFVCSTCHKCVFNANHDNCITKFLKEVNSRAKVQSLKTRNNNKPVVPKSHTQKPGRQIAIGQRFSPKKSSAVHKKPNTSRSCLRWKPTGRIFKIAGLRWIPTGNMFTDNTTKVDSEPSNGSNDDITNSYECDQTLNVSSSGLSLQLQMTSADNTSGPAAQRKESSGPGPQFLTPRTISSGLVPQPPSPTPNVPPTKNDWDLLFCPKFDEYFNPSPSVVQHVLVVVVQEPVVSTGTPSSTRIDQDTPSTSTSQTTQEEQSHVIPTSVEEDDHGIEVAHMDNDL